MTGIERLRVLGRCYAENDDVTARAHGYVLTSIADQIERDLREERDRWDEELCEAQMDKTRVMAVYLEMNKHVSGVEGAEDSPVAHWARELRRALKSDTSDKRDAQNPSCADPAETAGVTSEAAKVTREDAEAAAWVREHGGLGRVKQRRYESIPRAAYERKRRALLGHIAECETALGKRREAIARLADENDALRLERAQMRPRLMPEGMEWPRFEDGEPLEFGDEVLCDGRCSPAVVDFIELDRSGFKLYAKSGHLIAGADLRYGERVKRPEPNDSWGKWRKNLEADALGYAQDAYHGLKTSIDFDEYERRAKALAERDA